MARLREAGERAAEARVKEMGGRRLEVEVDEEMVGLSRPSMRSQALSPADEHLGNEKVRPFSRQHLQLLRVGSVHGHVPLVDSGADAAEDGRGLRRIARNECRGEELAEEGREEGTEAEGVAASVSICFRSGLRSEPSALSSSIGRVSKQQTGIWPLKRH